MIAAIVIAVFVMLFASAADQRRSSSGTRR